MAYLSVRVEHDVYWDFEFDLPSAEFTRVMGIPDPREQAIQLCLGLSRTSLHHWDFDQLPQATFARVVADVLQAYFDQFPAQDPVVPSPGTALDPATFHLPDRAALEQLFGGAAHASGCDPDPAATPGSNPADLPEE